MLTYNSEISHHTRRENQTMELDLEPAAEMSPISIQDYESAVDHAALVSSLTMDSPSDGGLLQALTSKVEVSKAMASIGSCNVDLTDEETLFEESTDLSASLESQISQDVLHRVEVELKPDTLREVKAQLSSVRAGESRGVRREHLSKIWKIKEDLADAAIDHNTQLCKRHADNGLSRNFSTNDRMLRYKRINSVFFTDTLLSLKCPSK